MARSYTLPNGQAVSQQQFEQHWNNVFASDPVLQQLNAIAHSHALKPEDVKALDAATKKRAAELGWSPASGDHDMHIKWKGGKLTATRGSFLERNADWIAAIGAGAAILGPFAAAWAAAAPSVPGLSAGSTLPALPGATGLTAPPVAGLTPMAGTTLIPGGAGATGGGASLLPGAGAATGSGAGATGAGAGATGAGAAADFEWQGPPTPANLSARGGLNLPKWAQKALGESWPLLAGLGLDWLDRKALNDAIEKANKIEQGRIDEEHRRQDASKFTEGQLYNQYRQDYQQLAMPSFQKLGSLLGFNIPDVKPAPFAPRPTDPNPYGTPPPAQTPAPTPTPPARTARSNPAGPRSLTADPGMSTLASFANVGQTSLTPPPSRTVKMQAPNGEIQDVNEQDVSHYESLGAKRVA